jgi:hypothetical protein
MLLFCKTEDEDEVYDLIVAVTPLTCPSEFFYQSNMVNIFLKKVPEINFLV